MFSIEKWSVYKNVFIRFVFLLKVVKVGVDRVNIMIPSDSLKTNYIYLTI